MSYNNNDYTYKKNNKYQSLSLLLGPNFRQWRYDKNRLYHVTPFYISIQMSKCADLLYVPPQVNINVNNPLSGHIGSGHNPWSLLMPLDLDPNSNLRNKYSIWDMFGGIGTDSIYLSKYFNIFTTELDILIYNNLLQNIRTHNIKNINAINDNCISLLNIIKPDIVYFDPPWGDTYKPKIKNFDFSNVFIDCPNNCTTDKNSALGGSNDIVKYINCIDLIKYVFNNITRKIIIKSPINSYTFDTLFKHNIFYIQRFQHKNLKFLFIA